MLLQELKRSHLVKGTRCCIRIHVLPSEYGLVVHFDQNCFFQNRFYEERRLTT